MGDRSEEIIELGSVSPPQNTVQLKPTMVTGPFLGIRQGLSFLHNGIILTINIGELPEQKINIVEAKTPPYHIYFEYPDRGLNLWYQCANTNLERDNLLALIKHSGAVNILFGNAKPRFTAIDLPDAYRQKHELSAIEQLVDEVSGPSKFQSRYTDKELQSLQREIENQAQNFPLFLENRKNIVQGQKVTPEKSSDPEDQLHPVSIALLMALIPTGGWALFNTGVFQLSAVSSLAINSLVVPPFAALFITNTFEELATQAYLNKHHCKKQDLPRHVAEQITTRSYYMGAQFIAGSAISQIMAFAVLNELSNTFSGGAIIGGAPIEAQMLMMALSGVVFGASMLAVKMVEAYRTGKQLSPAQMISSFVTGLMAGMGFYLASIIPGLNHAYGAGMPNWSSALVSCLGYMAVLAGTFGPYMHISHAQYEKQAPLPSPNTKVMLRMSQTSNGKDTSNNNPSQSATDKREIVPQ